MQHVFQLTFLKVPHGCGCLLSLKLLQIGTYCVCRHMPLVCVELLFALLLSYVNITDHGVFMMEDLISSS